MKTLFIFACVVVVLFLATPNKVEGQKKKVAAKTMEGIVTGHDGTRYWSGLKIDSGGKEYIFVTEFNARQGTNPKIVGGDCCDVGTKIKVTYIGSVTRYLLNVTSIEILGNPTVAVAQAAIPTSQSVETKTNPGVARKSGEEMGFAGEWSDGTSWLTIFKDDTSFKAVYPSGHDPQVLYGQLLSNNQLKLKNNRNQFFKLLDMYEGDYENEAWIDLGVDGASITVRFSQARGGRTLVLKRIPGNTVSSGSGANSVVWRSISEGSDTCALTMTGTPYCWGSGSYSDDGSPGLVKVIGEMNMADVSVGEFATCWLTTTGAAYCSSDRAGLGILGNGRTESSSVPVAVSGGHMFSVISVGKDHVCGLTISGAAYCWGHNQREQLGNVERVWTIKNPGYTDNTYGFLSEFSATPFPVWGGLRFVTLSAGEFHTCAVTGGGDAYCWGEGSSGQLGNGATERSAKPVAVAGGLKFKSVTASTQGDSFTCGITTSGAAYCWGEAVKYQFGDLQTQQSSVPVAVEGGLTFTALTMGHGHICGITTTGSAYCWGDNRWGQLGTGSLKAAMTPVPVSGSLKFKSISAGGLNTWGVTVNGEIYGWGNHGYGESESAQSSLIPVNVVRMKGDEDGFKAFFRAFSSAVRNRDAAILESMMSPAISFKVDIRSPRMALDYLGYKNGEGWKTLEAAVSYGTEPYRDSGPKPVVRTTGSVFFARGSDGTWRWIRFTGM